MSTIVDISGETLYNTYVRSFLFFREIGEESASCIGYEEDEDSAYYDMGNERAHIDKSVKGDHGKDCEHYLYGDQSSGIDEKLFASENAFVFYFHILESGDDSEYYYVG